MIRRIPKRPKRDKEEKEDPKTAQEGTKAGPWAIHPSILGHVGGLASRPGFRGFAGEAARQGKNNSAPRVSVTLETSGGGPVEARAVYVGRRGGPSSPRLDAARKTGAFGPQEGSGDRI